MTPRSAGRVSHDGVSGEGNNPQDVRAPDGYLVYYDAPNDRVYIVKDGTTTFRFDDGSAPGGWPTSAHPIASYVRDHQETYDGREAINDDQDFDGLPDSEEDAKFTDPEDADTDDDGLSDRQEFAYGTLPGDPDFDDDGVQDGTWGNLAEKADTDGDGAAWDPGADLGLGGRTAEPIRAARAINCDFN